MPAHPPPQEFSTSKNLSPPAISCTSRAGMSQETSPPPQDTFILPPTCNLPEGAIISPQEFLLLSALTSDQGEIPRIPSTATDPQPPTFRCNTPYLIQEANRLFTSFRAGNLPFSTFQTELEATFLEISLFNRQTIFFVGFNTRLKYQDYIHLLPIPVFFVNNLSDSIPNENAHKTTKRPSQREGEEDSGASCP
jgi:hypothetical protein